MRRPCADREEKLVNHGTVRKKVQEYLDLNGPNQRGLSDLSEALH